MSKNESDNREQFEKAGEQAGQLFGRFMTVATEIANEFNSARQEKSAQQDPGDVHQQSNDAGADALREAGEHLRNMREAAGYTLDSFASALEKEINKQQDDVAVVSKVEAAESGREALPLDWLNQVSMLLSNGDPVRFFEKLQRSYVSVNPDHHADANSHTAAKPAAQYDEAHVVPGGQVVSERVRKFSLIFESDAGLEQLTQAQFEKLLEFMENSYRDGRKLIG